MKNLARLTIQFSLTFIALFTFFIVFGFLGAWMENSLRLISPVPEQSTPLINVIQNALPSSLIMALLFSLAYSGAQKASSPGSILTLLVLSGAFCVGLYSGIERIAAYNPSLELPGKPGQSQGLILSQANTDVILLGQPSSLENTTGFPRVISFPDRPLVYQEKSLGPAAALPSLPLIRESPWFLQSIIMDFTLVAREFENRRVEGFISFLVYSVSFLFLLTTIRCFMGLSAWPLVDLFLAALVFRLILSLAVFLMSREITVFLAAFANGRIPDFLVTPAIFALLGVLIIFSALLAFLARRAGKNNG